MAGVSIGNYMLFAGGHDGTNYSAVVDAYSSSLVHSAAPSLSVSMASGHAAAPIGNYALIGGGWSSATTINGVVNAYDASLVRTSPFSISARGCKAASNSNYAIFSFGPNKNSFYSRLDAYDKNLVHSSFNANFGTEQSTVDGGGTAGEYVIFSAFSIGYAYGLNFTQTIVYGVYVGQNRITDTVATRDHAMFFTRAGQSPSWSVRAYAIDANLAGTEFFPAFPYVSKIYSAKIGEFGMLLGGNDSGSTPAYSYWADDNLLFCEGPAPSVQRSAPTGANIENYALFAGGAVTNTASKKTNAVEAFMLSA